MELPIGDFEGDLDVTVTTDNEDHLEKKLDRIVSWGQRAVKRFDRAQDRIKGLLGRKRETRKVDSRDVKVVQAF